MKNASRKIITSVLTLVLTIVALGATTFAWFSLSTVSNVSNITGDIRAGDGLEIQLVATKEVEDEDPIVKESPWRSNLSSEDVKAVIDAVFATEKFTAVTSTVVGTFTKAGLTDNGNIWIGEATEANYDYIKLTVNLRSKQTGTVVLSKLEFNALGNDVPFTPDGTEYLQAGAIEGNNKVITNAAYGARVAVGSVVFQYGGTPIALNTTVSPNQIEGNTIMTGTSSIEAGQYSYLTTGKGLTIYNNKDETGGVVAAAGGSMIEAHTNIMDDSNYRVQSALTVSGDYHVTSFDVYIWIEGWDADTYDSIYSAKLDVSFAFEKLSA